MIRTVRVEVERDPGDGWWTEAVADVTLDDREPRFGEVPEPAVVKWLRVLPSYDGATVRPVTNEDDLSMHEEWAIERAEEQCRG